MVASGLNTDDRTWVSAYKLIVHLGVATSLFGYLFWTWLKAAQPVTADSHFKKLKKMGWIIAGVLFVQIIFGGLMAGMRAGLLHPYISVFVEGDRFWNALTAIEGVGVNQIVDYEPNSFVKAAVQLLHRGTAWILSALIILFFINVNKVNASTRLKRGTMVLVAVLITQILLGISTVINSIGRIPLVLGAVHQAVALLLLICLLFVNYQFKKTKRV